MTRDEDVIGWVKYIDHNGSEATELVICNQDEDGAIPICRQDRCIAREKAILDSLIEYLEHDSKCLCSQWRQGEPTEDGRYRRLFGYGKQEKWYYDNDEPECSCGLTETINRLRGK